MAEIIHTAQWLANAMPEFAKFRHELQMHLNGDVTKPKRKLKLENVEVDWSDELIQVWKNFTTLLKTSRDHNLQHYDPEKEILLIADASDRYWSSIVMQVPSLSDEKEIKLLSLNVKPLLFLSGKFSQQQVKWHISEKEIYPLVHTFQRCKHLIVNPSKVVNIVTDHLALKYIFKPSQKANKSTNGRLARWAMLMQQTKLRVYHVPSEDNVFCDLLSRWGYVKQNSDALTVDENTTFTGRIENFNIKDEFNVKAVLKRYEKRTSRKELLDFIKELGHLFKDDHISFLHPYYEGKYGVLTEEKLIRLQLQSKLIKKGDELLRDDKNRIILKKSSLVELIVLIHIQNRHTSLKVDFKSLKEFSVIGFTLKKLEEILQNYRRLCLHCARSPHIFRIPLKKTITASRPRELIHLDYLYVNSYGAVIVLIDSYSRKTLIRKVEDETAENAAKAILEWDALFVLETDFMIKTDKGSHFANQLFRALMLKLRGKHLLAISYAPWTNGAVENKNPQLLKLIRQFLSEMRLGRDEWHLVLDQIMSIINNIKMPTRLNKTANELFLYVSKKNLIVPLAVKKLKLLELKDPEVFTEDCNELKKFLDKKLMTIYDSVQMAKDFANYNANEKNIDTFISIQYQIGDWVLMSLKDHPNFKDKTSKIWQGPFRVKDIIGNNSYLIVNPLNRNKPYRIHANRLWFYNDKNWIPPAYLKNLTRLQWSNLEINKLKKIFIDEAGEIKVVVDWRGFDDDTDEPLLNVINGAHLLLIKFIETNRSRLNKKLIEEVLNEVKKYQNEAINNTNLVTLTKTLPKEDVLIEVKVFEKSYILGWTKEEVETLKICLQQVPFAQWNIFNKYLPSKNKEQIINKIKRLLGYQSYAKWKGKFILLNKLTNAKNYVKRQPIALEKKEENVEDLIDFKIQVKPFSDEEIKVTLDRDLRKLLIFHRQLQKAKDFYKLFEKRILFDIKKILNNNKNIGVLPVDKLVLDQHNYRIEEEKDNCFTIETEDVKFNLQFIDEEAKIVTRNLLELKSCENIDYLIADPPWNFLQKNPTRGPNITYPTLSKKDIFRIIKSSLPKKMLFLWVVNSVMEEALEVIENNDFKVVSYFDHVKLNVSGKLHKSLGFYLQHAKDICIVAIPKKKKFKETFPRVILRYYEGPSTKSKDLHYIIDKIANKNDNKVEFFARNNNVTRDWIHYGNQLRSKTEITSVYLKKKELPMDFRVER